MLLSRRVAVTVTALAALTVAAPVTACSSGPPAPASPASPTSPASSGSSSTSPGASVSGGGTSGGGDSASVPAPGSAAIVPAAAATANWHACGGSLTGLRCTSLQVPLNYADPGGRKISLALSMSPATAPRSQQQGVLLVNPGGPGASGLSLAGAVAAGLDPGVAADYDIVGFDPRGVGSSVPALSCDPGFFSGVRPDYVPANAAAEQVLIGRAKMYANDCQRRFGWLLPYLTTANAARDINSIRQAFGVRKISYYAFSYGTYLGQVYATLFPGGLRRMVLDSTVDPTGAWYADNIAQDYAFQARLQAFFAWIARYDANYHLGTTAAAVRAAWSQARDRLEAHPASGPHGPLIGPDEFDDTFLIGGYQNTLWPALATALSQYLNNGSASALIAQYDENGVQDENEFAIYNAVQCSDVNWPRNWAKWQSDTEKVYQTAPFQAWDNAWYNAACAFWPVHGPAQPMRIKGAGLPPILMLQGTLDAATPYAGAQDAHRLLPSARMVVVTHGGNHGQSLQSPSDNCVQRYLNGYLSSGSLPEQPGLVNATCPAVPDPTPGG